MKQSSRFVSLDILRGLTVIGMILVNAIGVGNPPLQLIHSPWNGCRVADLIYPFFLFIVGASVFFSLRKTQWHLSRPTAIKILRRTVLIALIGFLLNIYPFTSAPSTWRFMGVMQRIALVYAATALIAFAVKKASRMLAISATILIAYAALMLIFGMDLTDNPILTVDRWLVGDAHLFRGYGIPFDPEGALSSVPAIANGLLGFVAAKWMLDARRQGRPFAVKTLTLGLMLLLLGWAASWIVPFNKPLWSSSFVLWTSGWAATLWSLISWIADTRGWTRWATVPLHFGSNALAIYVLSELILITDWKIPFTYHGQPIHISQWLDLVATHALPEPLRSLAWGLLILLICGLVAHSLYRRRLFIKL